MLNYEIITCPFCERGEVSCYRIPSVWTQKRSRTATFGSKTNVKKSKEQLIIRVGCPVCKKTKEEIGEWYRKEG